MHKISIFIYFIVCYSSMLFSQISVWEKYVFYGYDVGQCMTLHESNWMLRDAWVRIVDWLM